MDARCKRKRPDLAVDANARASREESGLMNSRRVHVDSRLVHDEVVPEGRGTR